MFARITTYQADPAKLDEEALALFHLFLARLANVFITAFSQHRLHYCKPRDDLRANACRPWALNAGV